MHVLGCVSGGLALLAGQGMLQDNQTHETQKKQSAKNNCMCLIGDLTRSASIDWWNVFSFHHLPRFR
jgi:hypothetical protein